MVERSAIDDHLEAVLRSIGPRLDVGPIEPLDTAAISADRRSWPRVLLLAAAVIVVAAAVVLATPARGAVARWLGIGSTEVRVVADPDESASTDRIIDGLEPIPAADAAVLIGRPLPTVGDPLGQPDAVYAMPEGGVLLAWSVAGATLWIHPAEIDPAVLGTKLIGSERDVETIDDLGDGGLYVAGDHVLTTPHRRVRADSVVLWTADGIEYRLEADRSSAELIALARTIDGAR